MYDSRQNGLTVPVLGPPVPHKLPLRAISDRDISYLVRSTEPQTTQFRAPLWDAEEPISAEDREAAVHHVGDGEAEPADEEIGFEHLHAKMMRQGFCPHQIMYLAQRYDKESMRRFASLDRRQSRPEDHGPCLNEKRCIAYNSPLEKGYTTKHCDDCRDCSWVKTPKQALLNIVRTGGVPLISIHENPCGVLTLRVHRRGFFSRYATISHVWADGLGNPFANALPTCQIRKLRELLGQVIERNDAEKAEDFLFNPFGKKMFWMDTLCIPVGDEHADLRDRCVDNMASIYAGSSPVFVLDKELMEAPVISSELHDCQKPLQIAASVWMCRSWTLQEAKLPRACVFKFSDGIYRPWSKYRNSNDAITNLIFEDFLEVNVKDPTALLDPFDNFCNVLFMEDLGNKSTEDEVLARFLSTWNDLAGRSTTQAADLWVVLATCMEFRLRQFRKFPTCEEKMRCIISSFRTLPLSLFFNTGPRLHQSANHLNRWMPIEVSNFILSTGSTFELPGPKVSRYSDQGVRLKLHFESDIRGLLVDVTIPKLGTFILRRGRKRYAVVLNIDPLDQLDISDYNGTCIIFESFTSNLGSLLRGACFYVVTSPTSQDDGKGKHQHLELVYLCPVTVVEYKSRDDMDQTGQAEYASRKLVSSSQEVWVKFGKLASTYHWCHHCQHKIADPIPAFVPLKRQSVRRQYDASFNLAAWSTAVLYGISVGTYYALMIYFGLYFVGVKVWFHEQIDATWFGHIPVFIAHELETYRPNWIDKYGKGVFLGAFYVFTMFLLTISWIAPIAALLLTIPPLCVLACISYVCGRIQDYLFLYQSFDDNTTWDRLLRLGGIIFNGLWHGISSMLVPVWRLLHPRRREIAIEEIEF